MSESELTKLLSNYDLVNYCKFLHIPLIDINFKDKIKITKPGCYIINLDDSTLLDGFNGTHWVALFVTTTEAVYNDSFGLGIPTIILKKIKKYNNKIKIFHNANQYQTIKSIYCGWYCLLFLFICKSNLKANMRVLLNKYRKIFFYDKNRFQNDDILKNKIKQIFRTIK
jgi:hypothetical protein